MTLAEMTANMEDEVIQGELLRKIDSMHRQNKSSTTMHDLCY